jgi:hypothetical protein
MNEPDAATRYVDALLKRAAQRPDLPVTLLYRDPMPKIEVANETLTATYASVRSRLRSMCGDDVSEAGVGRIVLRTDEGSFVFDLAFHEGAEHAWCEVMVAPQV